MSRKLTYQEVKQFIEVESGSGCKLISKDYKSNQEKMLFECKCGNVFETTWNTFKTKNKRQCNDCGYEKTKKSRRLPYSEVKNEFEKRGYELVSKKYNNSYENLDFICKEHNQQGVQDISLDNLRYGHGCRFCSGYECINDYIKIDDFYILNIISDDYNVDVFIDNEDVDKIKKYKWYFNKKSGYIQSHKVEGKRGYLHTFILSCPEGKAIDHVNRDKLDNRKANLRICTNTENAQNRGIPINNKSGVVGVGWHNKSNKWRAFIIVNKEHVHLGLFDDIESATEARKKAEISYFGEYSPNYSSLIN